MREKNCSVSLTVEIPDASVAAQESTKLYQLLQTAVDGEIQTVGYMPDASTYGMKPSQNGNGNGHSSHKQPPPLRRLFPYVFEERASTAPPRKVLAPAL